ncbi:hypothetical protein Dsin_033052 [Dipteronia sinensis]|uniref:Importin N-terminal domain-containing protein n=1 Tax=Dipteronia sinensis TaxID=43782 RepID=A0AAE0DP17_9ROSI|nr:hypothetical protein Dsin_033052 [Dipteronia sinensis]
MEQQVLSLLQATLTPNTATVSNAEQALKSLYNQSEYPFALLSLATHTDLNIGLRKSALTNFRQYIDATWSPQLEEDFQGAVYLNDEAKSQIRDKTWSVCVNADGTVDGSLQRLASSAVAHIASVDFPDNWPGLFPEIISILKTNQQDAAAQGTLRVLHEVVDAGLSQDQFFMVAPDMVDALQHITQNTQHNPLVKASAIKVLRSCLETLEGVFETDNGPAARAFLDDALKHWFPYLMHVLRQPLPEVTQEDFQKGPIDVTNKWKGEVALKTQAITMLEKVAKVRGPALLPHVSELFSIVWDELNRLAPGYTQIFVDADNSESRLIDTDGIPYSLDFLILEELDFLASALKQKVVREELSMQMQQVPGAEHTVGWLQELIRVLVIYTRIPREEEAFWEFDVNTYLCELSELTSNYTPRVAASQLLVNSLVEWLKQTPVKALLTFHEQQTSSYLQHENHFVRAGAHLALGSLFAIAPPAFHEAALGALHAAISAAQNDDSMLVQVICVIAISQYLKALPRAIGAPLQGAVIDAVKHFVDSHDLRDELESADDVKSAIIVTLRTAIMLDVSNLDSSPAMDLFFSFASDGAANFQLSELLADSFKDIVSSVAELGPEPYVRLCAKVIPSLSGAFDVAILTEESALTDLAAELVSALAEFGIDPLPGGFVGAVMPKIQRILMEGTEATLLQPATSALTHMLNKGTVQVKSWSDHSGKPSVQVCLEVVDRLLNPAYIEESAADEVGYLASTMVTKFGFESMGDYLPQLLRAVAIRLSSATRAAFIQSLLMVFASLAVHHADAVLDFLNQTEINGQNGLKVTLTQWLENSVNFAGFDEIRTNVVALSHIFELNDPRVISIQVRGDLIIEDTGRIKTRSRAKANPDRYMMIPADVKILKLLVDELHHAATSQFSNLAAARYAAEAADDVENDDGDDDWEDDDDLLDLSSEKVKNELMMFAGEGSPTGSRARDDETADYLQNWFRNQVQKQEFQNKAGMLNAEEQDRLRKLVG